MTVEVRLTKGYTALVDECDAEWVALTRWHATSCNGVIYAKRSIFTGGEKRNEYMHRVVVEAQACQHVDHINGDPLDNRRCNLRCCSRSENLMNRPKQRDNTTGYKGVTFSKRYKWFVAQIGARGINYRIGQFATAEDAARAYDIEAIRLHGEFAKLNFPLGGEGVAAPVVRTQPTDFLPHASDLLANQLDAGDVQGAAQSRQGIGGG